MSKDDQMILAVPAGPINEKTADKETISPDVFRHFVDTQGFFGRRGDLEKDPSYRQIIPYIVITHGIDDLLIFRYRRGSTGGENRLHHFWSIGIGGHVEKNNEVVQSNMQCIEMDAWRELHEEVEFNERIKIPHLRMMGYISLSDNEVSSVHLGVVYRLNLPKMDVRPKEDCIEAPGWVTIDEIRNSAGTYELWSLAAAGMLRVSQDFS